MAEKKFAKYIKRLEFKDRGPSNYRQVATINGKEFNVDFNIEYGAYWAAGRMAEGAIEAHKHDYNQILFFLGADPNDMGELNADIELCMGEGEELDKLRVVNTSAVAIPAGLAHYPSTITTMKKRFLYMEISQSNELKEEIKGLGNAPSNRQLVELDFRFHRGLYHATKNSQLAQLLDRLLSHYLRFWLSIPREIEPKSFFKETAEIIRAVESKDNARVKEASTEHIKKSIDEIMGTF